MKKSFLYGGIVTVLGLFIALGPQFLFKLCGGGCSCCGDVPTCHWSGQAEIGLGMLIAALGICIFVFTDAKTQFGLLIGIFFAGIIALCIPHVLIGGCGMMTMACRKIAFPAITVECVVLLVFSAVVAVYSEMKKKPTDGTAV